MKIWESPVLQTNRGEKASHFPMPTLKVFAFWQTDTSGYNFPSWFPPIPRDLGTSISLFLVSDTDLEGIGSSSWVSIKNLGRNPGGKVFTLSTYMKVLGISPEEGGQEFMGLGEGSKKPAAATSEQEEDSDSSNKDSWECMSSLVPLPLRAAVTLTPASWAPGSLQTVPVQLQVCTSEAGWKPQELLEGRHFPAERRGSLSSLALHSHVNWESFLHPASRQATLTGLCVAMPGWHPRKKHLSSHFQISLCIAQEPGKG